MCEENQNNKGKQCARCISRRIDCRGEINCSLGIWINELGEKCGSFEYGYRSIDDYKFEFKGLSVDEVTDDWLNGTLE